MRSPQPAPFSSSVSANGALDKYGPPPSLHNWGRLGFGHHSRVGDIECLAVALDPAATGGVEIHQPLGLRGPVWKQYRKAVLGGEHIQRCPVLSAGPAANMLQHAVGGDPAGPQPYELVGCQAIPSRIPLRDCIGLIPLPHEQCSQAADRLPHTTA